MLGRREWWEMTGWMVPPFARKSDVARAISVGISCAFPFPCRRLRCRSVCGNAALCKRRLGDPLRRAMVEPTARSVFVSPHCGFVLGDALWIPALRSGLRTTWLGECPDWQCTGIPGLPLRGAPRPQLPENAGPSFGRHSLSRASSRSWASASSRSGTFAPGTRPAKSHLASRINSS